MQPLLLRLCLFFVMFCTCKQFCDFFPAYLNAKEGKKRGSRGAEQTRATQHKRNFCPKVKAKNKKKKQPVGKQNGHRLILLIIKPCIISVRVFLSFFFFFPIPSLPLRSTFKITRKRCPTAIRIFKAIT